MSLPARMADKVRLDSSGCWIWTGAIQSRGYGSFSVGGRSVLAHRHAYEVLVGPVPDGLELDHLCRRKACVNPSHLEPVTSRENKVRGGSIDKAACRHGHPLVDGNVYRHPRGSRECRTCRSAQFSRRQLADTGRADSSFLLYVTVVLAAVFVAALTKPGQALAVLGLAVTVGVVLRHVLAAHYRGVARVESARHRGVIR